LFSAKASFKDFFISSFSFSFLSTSSRSLSNSDEELMSWLAGRVAVDLRRAISKTKRRRKMIKERERGRRRRRRKEKEKR